MITGNILTQGVLSGGVLLCTCTIYHCLRLGIYCISSEAKSCDSLPYDHWGVLTLRWGWCLITFRAFSNNQADLTCKVRWCSGLCPVRVYIDQFSLFVFSCLCLYFNLHYVPLNVSSSYLFVYSCSGSMCCCLCCCCTTKVNLNFLGCIFLKYWLFKHVTQLITLNVYLVFIIGNSTWIDSLIVCSSVVQCFIIVMCFGIVFFFFFRAPCIDPNVYLCLIILFILVESCLSLFYLCIKLFFVEVSGAHGIILYLFIFYLFF